MAKKSQIAVGQEWACGRRRGKRRRHYIGGYYNKVTIVWIALRGSGVQVQYHELDQGETRIIDTIVQLSQLFMPWAEYEVKRAEYVEAEKIREEKAKIAEAKREKFKEEVFNPALKEFFAVIKPFAGNKYVDGWTKIEELPVGVLVAVTEAMKEKEGAK
jgi:hypothetical protein